MKKFVAAVAAMILVILPSTASASSFQLVGKCTIENGKVTLFGEVSGYGRTGLSDGVGVPYAVSRQRRVAVGDVRRHISTDSDRRW